MNYSTEKDDYLMTTPYTKKIQQKFEKVKSFFTITPPTDLIQGKTVLMYSRNKSAF